METVLIRSQADLDRMLADVRDVFTRIKWGPFLESEMRLMEAAHDSYWRAQAGPSGAGWPANMPSTIRAKKHSVILVGIRPKRRSEPILRDSLTMPYADGAIRIAVDEWPLARIYFGSDVWYSAIHNEGKNQKKREHIGLTLPHFESMGDRATTYALGKLKT